MTDKKKAELKSTLAETYPSVAEFVFQQGRIELGYEPNTGTFARAIDEGGMIWGGGTKQMSLEELLEAMDKGIDDESDGWR